MRSKGTIPGWQYALTTLRNSQPELTGTEEHLYSCLRFSYESLVNDIMIECFCYCALFPEDYGIVSLLDAGLEKVSLMTAIILMRLGIRAMPSLRA